MPESNRIPLVTKLALLLVVVLSVHIRAQSTQPAGSDMSFGNNAASLTVPGAVDYRYPTGPRGFYKHGFRLDDDSTRDWTGLWGVRCEVNLPDGREVELTCTLDTARASGPDKQVQAIVRVAGAGWHSLKLPWSAFNFDQASTGFLRYGRGISIAAKWVDAGAPASIQLRGVAPILAPVVALQCDVRGKTAAKGQMAEYELTVSNCTDQPQAIVLSFEKYGWEVMTASAEPANFLLAPGEQKRVAVRVTVSTRVPPGGHEQQIVKAVANGDATTAQSLGLITTCELPHPYILHTAARWQDVRDKVNSLDWAKAAADVYLKQADKWVVPEIAQPPANDPNDTYGPFLFHTQVENDLLAAAYSWELTGNRAYAEKVATFLRRLSDPQNGYPKTLRGCNQSLVQEGHFFQHIAMSYDIIRASGVLNDADIRQIEATFRVFMATIDREASHGAINNWNLSECCGAFYCALSMQDLVAADRFFAGPSGICDQLGKGTMDDGWWYECSISYNMWCASEFTQAALAYQPFGFNFLHQWVPANFSPSVMLSAELSGGSGVESPDPQMKGKPFGMDPSIYGPIRRPYRTITDLWNSLLPFIDYRGVMFGVNDSTENKVTGNRTEVSGQPFEIAYFAYRDPAYAAIIERGDGKRDLLYGVPDLPKDMPQQCRDSAYADNVGLAMLRSQTPNRPISEQIQAVLHYGTHGWAHGHYDRTDLLSLMRYGRSFWNPESVFYVYEPFMYKFFTQTSVNHNMVVVDQKMQQATPGDRILFYTGKAMQATAVQTTARWSNPPYGGMVYDYVPVKTFEEKTWREGRYVPIPTTAPAYGTLTDFTEPILQRRLMIVTDDYVLLADYLKGTRPHTFDDLLQLKGFEGLDGPQKTFMRHDAQWNPDPLGSAQFVTDCNWYSVAAPSLAQFKEQWGPGIDEEGSRSIGNEPGVLNLDVHTLWPQEQQIMIGTAPEQHNTEKRLFYTVAGDGKTLAEGKFGAWILGKADIDVSVEGVKQLTLQTKTELSKRPTLFWAGAVIITTDGKKIPLSQLPLKTENISPAKGTDQDYDGGPVKIVGDEYKDDVAAEPHDAKQPGIITVDLSGIHASRFKTVLGSDYPPGDEFNARKTFAVRSQGTEARFLTIIEPYETHAVVRSATATGFDSVDVELADGRHQKLAIHNVDGDGTEISVDLTESKEGKVIRSESTQNTAEPQRKE